MFDRLIKEIGRLHGVSVSVPMKSDEEGYFDRACPSSKCEFEFKIHEDDWREKIRDEGAFCPFCRHRANVDQWWTREQRKRAEEVALNRVQHRLGNAMRRDADGWNSRHRGDNLIRITLDVKSQPRHVMLPEAVAEPMRLKIGCPECACRYAVIGAAFFCPACGHNAAGQVFERSIAGVLAALDALPTVRGVITDRDVLETMTRQAIENGLQTAVTTFQRYVEVTFASHTSPPRARRNVFQNLSEGSELWRVAFGKGYEDHLDSHEIATLNRYFQQRHLLAHREGIVDESYIHRSGDPSYQSGQRIVIREAAVRECLDLVARLAGGLGHDAEAWRACSGDSSQ